MDTGSTSNEDGTAAAQSAAHIGMQLFHKAVTAADAAAKTGTRAAGTAARTAGDLGNGPFAMAIKEGRRPCDSEWRFLDELHEFHSSVARDLDQAIDRSQNYYRPQFADALTGEAGDALLASHDENTSLWKADHAEHQEAAKGAFWASHLTQTLQSRIDSLAEAGQEEFDKAVKSRNLAAAQAIWATYSSQANDEVDETTSNITEALSGKFTIPADGAKGTGRQDAGRHSDESKQAGKTDRKPDAHHTDVGGPSKSDGHHTDDTDQSSVQKTGATAEGGSATTPHTDEPGQVSQPLLAPPGSGANSAGGGRLGGSGGGSGSGGMGGSGLSGLGSSMKPPAGLGSSQGGGVPGGLPSGGGVPGGTSTSPASASPLANAGSSFQSGLASGMSATGSGGGSTAPVSTVSQSLSQQQAAAAYAAQPPASAVPQVGSGPAGAPMGGGPSGAEVSGGAAQGGSSGAPLGGGGMMPPAGAMAPYSAPGSGAGGAVPAAPSVATSPASASSGGGGGPAAGPVMAAGHGSAGAASGLASSGTEVNPDLLLAQRVLGGLVRACENWPSLIVWAVSVVKTPVGSQIIIATGSGGGGYVPPTVVLPTTARLAVVDPVLPFGWATRWMGCQKPSKILADHFELFRKKTGGAQLSALVTTETFAEVPEGVQDFLALQHRDALALASEAPRLDGGHQHRLAAFDPGLAHRVANFEKIGPEVAVRATANVTAAVINAAHAEPDASGDKLVTTDETAVLQSVYRGNADDVGWALYDSLVRKRHNGVLEWPETHAPQDFDGSKLNHDMAHVYRKYFRMGQIAELVRCWKFSPPPLADAVYCGIHAGFGAVVVAEIGALEQQLRAAAGGHS